MAKAILITDNYTAVSIVIPTYRNERTIVRCVDSVILQVLGSVDVIVVCDDSVDRIAEL